MNTTCDVVVIGAGLAGLTAALALEAQGLLVRVLEARNRVGGRVHSMRELSSNPEAGGTYIGAGYARLIKAAEGHGVELIDVTPMLEFFREQDLVLGDEIITQAAWPNHPANPFPPADKHLMPWNYHRVLAMRENPLSAPKDWLDPRHAAYDVSVRHWMRGLGLSDAVADIGYGINPSFGSGPDDVSALLLLFRAAFSKIQRRQAPPDVLGFTARRGVQSIPEAMAGELRGEILFERIVTAIEQSAHDVRVHCAGGDIHRAHQVICTIPFPALRDVAFDPPLPEDLAEAVSGLDSQPLTQIYLAPRRPFWQDDGHSPSLFTDSIAGMVAAARSGEDPTQISGITVWAMGPQAIALDRLPPEQAGRKVIEAIERIRPAAKGQLELLAVQSWGGDPYARGAWAYWKPGQVAQFARALGRTHARVHFCGEHLALENRGMEGAMESAERVATAVLERV